jgi:hypothetical protein
LSTEGALHNLHPNDPPTSVEGGLLTKGWCPWPKLVRKKARGGTFGSPWPPRRRLFDGDL